MEHQRRSFALTNNISVRLASIIRTSSLLCVKGIAVRLSVAVDRNHHVRALDAGNIMLLLFGELRGVINRSA
jgi:hypothetical protein